MEELSDSRSEFVNGAIVAMSGATYPHVMIVDNLILELNSRLRGKSCRMSSSQLKVKVELTGDYFYPDLVAICGAPAFEDVKQTILLNPAFLIEVLSPSTEAYDRGQKFQHYQQIPSLKQYAMVSQDTPRVELFTRAENSAWTYISVSGMDKSVQFESIDCSLPLADIYRDVKPEPPQ